MPRRQTTTKTVQPSGGDFTTVNAALAALGEQTIRTRHRLLLWAGVHATEEIEDVGFVDIQGRGPIETTIDGSQPDDASAADIQANSTLYLRHTTRLEGLTARMRNGRYAVHIETQNIWLDTVQDLIDVDIEHLGNDDAVNDVWPAQYALSAGVSSGQVVRLRGSRLQAKNAGAILYHTNEDFAVPSLLDIEGCRIAVDSDAAGVYALDLAPLGSFQADQCRLVGNTFVGDIGYARSD